MTELFVYKLIVRTWEIKSLESVEDPDDYEIFAIAKDSRQARQKIQDGFLKNNPAYQGKNPYIIECRKCKKETPFRLTRKSNGYHAIQAGGEYILF